MLVKAEVTCYVKRDENGYFSQKVNCPECMHDSIICGWTVETKETPESEDFENYCRIVFLRPKDGFVEIILSDTVKEPFKIFFNLYAPNEVKNPEGNSADVSSGV